jgi:adenylate kinase
MSKFVVLFGPPGCGKGTQATRLKGSLGVPHVSTGEMFRDHGKRQTDIGKRAQSIIDAGKLVPDSITDEMVRERLGREDATGGVLLDGYPRNVSQAKELVKILSAMGQSILAVIAIEVPNEELMERLLKRGEHSGREDDKDPATIQGRLNVYVDQSEPCVSYYHSHTKVPVHRINGVGSVEKISERILAALA